MNTRILVANGLIAALYVAISLSIQPFAYGPLQFRLPEILNLLIVYNNKYFYGVILGVLITNLFSPLGLLDLGFGVGQSALALGLTILFSRFIKGELNRMVICTLIFTFTMFLIAWEIALVYKAPFWETWLFVAIGEFIVMAIGIPIIYSLNKRLKFKELV